MTIYTEASTETDTAKLEAAQAYLNCGWLPIRVNGKIPIGNAWQKQRPSQDDLQTWFERTASPNVGILLGKPSRWLVDIDLDHPLAVELGDQFIPETQAVFGRPSKPRSHRLFIAEGAATHQREVAEELGGMLLELRSTGGQTVFPPSRHISGEQIEWDTQGEPIVIDAAFLKACVDACGDEVERRLGIEPKNVAEIIPPRTATRDEATPDDEIEQAIEALAAIPANYADAYSSWLRIGMALRSVSDSLLTAWDNWSRSSPKYKEGETARKWQSFDPSGGVGPGTLFHLARANGWRPKRRKQNAEQRTSDPGNSQEDDDKESGGGLIKKLADSICRTDHFAQDAGGKLYHFVGGVYKPKAEQRIKAAVKALVIEWKLTAAWVPKLATDVVEFIRVDAPELWDRPPLDLLNVKNGLLRVADCVLLPHSPAHLSPIQLPVTFDPKATCPATEKFVGEVFPPDAIGLAWEIVAFLMLPNTSIQKAIQLIGLGGNGKSTWLAQLIAFLGKWNTSALPLHKLEADKFTASRLYGKLANICPDLPSEHLTGTSVFKSITGGDPITGEYKFKDSFDFTPFARLVFSANSPPRSADSSQGFFQRWLVIPFNRSFRDTAEEITRDVLDARLSAPAELSGLLNKALDALPRIKRGFSQPESIKAAWLEFHATTDPLAVWLDRWTIDSPDAVVTKKSLRIAFNADLERQGRPPVTDQGFGASFGKLRPMVQVKQRTVNGKMQWCYAGIGLTAANHNETTDLTDLTDNPLFVKSRGCVRESNDEWKVDENAGGNLTEREKSVRSVTPVSAVEQSAPTCNHIDPATWIVREGVAYCRGCDKWQGRVKGATA